MARGNSPEGNTPDPQGSGKAGEGGAAPTPNADGQPDEGEPDSDDGDGDDDGEPSGKTYTQAELDAIVNARIAKAKKAAKKEAMDQAKQEREREQMTEADRIKAEKEQADQKIAELEGRVKQSRIREQLAGKVVNLDDAVRVLDDSFVDDDTGEVDVEAFLTSKPYFRTPSGAGGQAKPGNPPSAKRLTREQIANMTEKEIEDRWEEVEAVLGSNRS